MSIDEICQSLTTPERRVVLMAGRGYQKFPQAMGVLAVNSCRNRYHLIECEDAERGIWRYRLTALGLRVQGALLGVPVSV